MAVPSPRRGHSAILRPMDLGSQYPHEPLRQPPVLEERLRKLEERITNLEVLLVRVAEKATDPRYQEGQ